MSGLAEFEKRLAALVDASRAADAGVEVVLLESESRSVGWGEGKPLLNNAAVSSGACVRALVDGGQGLSTTTVPNPETVRALSAQALEAARASAKDPNRRLARPASSYSAPVPVDEKLFQKPAAAIVEELRDIERRVLAKDRRLKKVVRMIYGERRGLRGVGNTDGVRLAESSTVASFSLELLADEGPHVEAAWDHRAERISSRLKISDVAEVTAEQAIRALGGKSLPTGKYPVVLHPRVGAQLLDLVGGALSAEAVQKGRSFFARQLGKPVASPLVSIVDDPLKVGGVASGAFDDEGVPSTPLSPVRRGVLEALFYDLRSATRDRVVSNGRASKPGLGSPPHPASTNLFVEPGVSAVEALLSSAPTVILLREVMGLHMADP
ncbi:MAG: TldD/PmbA family protein, partial [Elusimicrobia bacterium]|nr:TldD/PmbA family protein [Elusimicrobiota bacterium]